MTEEHFEELPARNERRTIILRWVFLLLFSSIGYRAATIQWRDSKFYIRQGDNRQLQTVRSDQVRGALLDRNGILLAGTSFEPSIYLDVDEAAFASPRQLTALANALSLDSKLLTATIESSAGTTILLGRGQTEQVLVKATAAMPDAVIARYFETRHHPAGAALESLIGSVNSHGVGVSGIERLFNAEIRQREGPLVVRKNLLGNVISIRQGAALAPGITKSELRTTLDLRLQILTHQVVTLLQQQTTDLSACLLITDAQTGEVLALDGVGKRPMELAREGGHAVSGQSFEPRFMLAPFVLLAGLRNDVFSTATLYPTSTSSLELTTLQHVAQPSKNIEVGKMLGPQAPQAIVAAGMHVRSPQLRETFAIVGLGEASGIGFEGELHDPIDETLWRSSDQSRIASGRGVQITLAQLARAYGALLSRGQLPPLSLSLRASPKEKANERTDAEHFTTVAQMIPKVPIPDGGRMIFIGDAYERAVPRGASHQQRQLVLAIGAYQLDARLLLASIYLDSTGRTPAELLAVAKSGLTAIFANAQRFADN